MQLYSTMRFAFMAGFFDFVQQLLDTIDLTPSADESSTDVEQNPKMTQDRTEPLLAGSFPNIMLP